MCCSIASYMTARFSSECFTAYTFCKIKRYWQR